MKYREAALLKGVVPETHLSLRYQIQTNCNSCMTRDLNPVTADGMHKKLTPGWIYYIGLNMGKIIMQGICEGKRQNHLLILPFGNYHLDFVDK